MNHLWIEAVGILVVLGAYVATAVATVVAAKKDGEATRALANSVARRLDAETAEIRKMVTAESDRVADSLSSHVAHESAKLEAIFAKIDGLNGKVDASNQTNTEAHAQLFRAVGRLEGAVQRFVNGTGKGES